MNREQQVLDFFARWEVSFDEMVAAMRETIAPVGVWDQRPFPRLRGPDQAERFLRVTRRATGLDRIGVETTAIAADGDVVHTARVDTLYSRSGRVIVAAPVAGVLTFRGDQLVYWREYFDAGSFAAQAARRAVLRR